MSLDRLMDELMNAEISSTSDLEVGGQRHAPAALLQGNRPGTHCIRGWVGRKAGLDGCEKSHIHGDSIPRLSIP